jgi:hypothetical protein
VRPLTRPWLLLAIAVVVVALPAAASGALSGPAVPAANSQTFQDSVGEDPAAPDISTIVVSNDDAGTITFRINVPNRAQLSQDLVAILDIDSDANQATGDPNNFGADFILQYLLGEAILFKWDGSDYTLERDTGVADQLVVERPDIQDQRVGLEQHASFCIRCARCLRCGVRPDNRGDRLHQLQA